MQKRRKLTWQGRDDGAGRWKKVYRGQVHDFSGGNGKSDLEAYREALTEWEQLKVTLDQVGQQNKPHRAEYEKVIRRAAELNIPAALAGRGLDPFSSSIKGS